eukprot:6598478-Heterocapsa_arctica.AAC.1
MCIRDRTKHNAFEAHDWTLKLRSCATLSAFCEESSGDSEDARRPFKNLQTPSTTVKAIYT